MFPSTNCLSVLRTEWSFIVYTVWRRGDLTTRLDMNRIYYSSSLHAEDLKTILYNFNITLIHIAYNIHWCCHGILALHFKIYSFTKLRHHAVYLIHQPTYVLSKIRSEATIHRPHVSAPGCHHQGVFQNKGLQAQHATVGIMLCRACTPLFWMAPRCRNM
jgi:hypothetical protein